MSINQNTGTDKEHVSRAKDPAIVRRSQKLKNFWSSLPSLIGAFILFMVVVFWLKSCGDDDDESPKSDTSATAAQVSTAPIIPEERWGFMPTIDIPPGGIPVYLYTGWKSFPLGGKITITAPDGQVLHDEPGVQYHFGYQPDGLYIVRANPEGSKRQVRFYNKL